MANSDPIKATLLPRSEQSFANRQDYPHHTLTHGKSFDKWA